MTRYARWLTAGAVVAVLAVGGWLWSGRGVAADADELKTGLPKLADAIEKKDAGAAGMVTKLSKDTEVKDLMELFERRRAGGKGGLGVGPTAGAITPDGVEAKIQDMAKKPLTAVQVTAQAAALNKMAYQTAAGAQITKALKPEKDMGKRKVADWVKWSEEMEAASMELAAATSAAKKDPTTIMNATKKLDAACVSCHNVFKTE